MSFDRTWTRPNGTILCRTARTEYAFAKAAKEGLADVYARAADGRAYSGGPAYRQFVACETQRAALAQMNRPAR